MWSNYIPTNTESVTERLPVHDTNKQTKIEPCQGPGFLLYASPRRESAMEWDDGPPHEQKKQIRSGTMMLNR